MCISLAFNPGHVEWSAAKPVRWARGWKWRLSAHQATTILTSQKRFTRISGIFKLTWVMYLYLKVVLLCKMAFKRMKDFENCRQKLVNNNVMKWAEAPQVLSQTMIADFLWSFVIESVAVPYGGCPVFRPMKQSPFVSRCLINLCTKWRQVIPYCLRLTWQLWPDYLSGRINLTNTVLILPLSHSFFLLILFKKSYCRTVVLEGTLDR